MTIFCNSPGDVKMPIKARGKTLYWSLKDKKGSFTSDLDGSLYAIFMTEEFIELKSVLKIALDQDFKKRISVAEEIYLPEESCTQNKLSDEG
jgi:hypothetical protein